MRDMPECPICGAECNEFYVSQYGGEIVGCENCIDTESAHERAEQDRIGYLQDKAYDERFEESLGLL